MIKRVVDLFCGVGGLTHGFILEGFDVVLGIDSDPSCRFPYQHNNNVPFLNARVEELTESDKAGLFPDGTNHRILIGCAPCQPFSNYMTGKSNRADNWQLVNHFAALIEELEPDVVSMENVPSLRGFDSGRIFEGFVTKLEALDYFVWSNNVYCPDYGIPQQRSRLVLLASKLGPIKLIPPTHRKDTYVNVRDTIGRLEALAAGECSATDPLHRARRLSNLNLARIRQSKPGGTWHDWDETLIASCHRRSSGQTYKSVYGRMRWDEPSPTITTQCYAYGSGRFGHPEQDRAISLREAALLQTFPVTYRFCRPDEPVTFINVGRHIGNAVPVQLARVIAKSISCHLEGSYVER